jgi:hypothetical protein
MGRRTVAKRRMTEGGEGRGFENEIKKPSKITDFNDAFSGIDKNIF